jgi:hypothetical protein
VAKSPALVVHASLLLLFLLVVLFLLGLPVGGCGTDFRINTFSNPREMQSLTISPGSVDAQTFPGGEVQFVVTATFNSDPVTVTSPPVLWSIGNPFPTPTPMPMSSGSISAGAPSVDASGRAQCNGFVGIVAVQATAPADPGMPLSQMNSMTMNVAGTARMTCP